MSFGPLTQAQIDALPEGALVVVGGVGSQAARRYRVGIDLYGDRYAVNMETGATVGLLFSLHTVRLVGLDE